VTAFKTRTVPKTWKAPDQRWLTFDQTPKPKP